MNAKPAAARRGISLAGVAAAALLLTSACAAGRAAQTADQIPTQDGTNATVHNMALRGLSIVAPQGISYAPGSDPQLRAVLVNTGTHNDVLTGITSTAATGWGSYATRSQAAQVEAGAGAAVTTPTVTASSAPAATPTSGAASTSVPITAGDRVSYGVPDATGALLLMNTTRKIYPGVEYKITFTFQRAGTVTVDVPVQLSTDPSESTIEPSGAASDG